MKPVTELYLFRHARKALSYLIVLFAWYLLSMRFHSNILPSPSEVFVQLYLIVWNGTFFNYFETTFLSVIASFLGSMVLGLSLGFLSKDKNFIGVLTKTLLEITIYLPSIVILYLVIITWGVGILGVIFAVTLSLTPEMGTIFSKALTSVEQKFSKINFIYRIPKISYLVNIALPELSPTILGMAKMNLAVSWKLVLVAEVFAQSKGIGYKIFESFSVFSIRKVLAWLIGTVLIFILFEFLIFKPFELFIQKRFKLK